MRTTPGVEKLTNLAYAKQFEGIVRFLLHLNLVNNLIAAFLLGLKAAIVNLDRYLDFI